MSLFISVKRYGAALRLIRIRSFATTIGLDLNGILMVGTPSINLFTIFRHNDSFSLLVESDGLKLNHEALSKSALRSLQSNDVLQVQDYIMSLQVSTRWAESYPDHAEHGVLSVLGSLEVTLLGLHQSVPLSNGSFTIGSTDSDSLVLPIQGVVPSHVCGTVTDQGITISPGSGITELHGRRLTAKHLLNAPTAIRLLPTGVPVLLSPHGIQAPDLLLSEKVNYDYIHGNSSELSVI